MAGFADGPFTPELNGALGEAFGGASLAGVSVTRGADADNRALGADATTRGHHISLSSSILEDLDDPYSMSVIAHEVAHALAGGGSGETDLDRDGDPGEVSADAAGLAFGHYAETGMTAPAPQLSPAHGGQAAIHRHEVEGPLDINDPVHETLTQETLKAAGIMGKDGKHTDARTYEYIRGVFWNDDPKSQLFRNTINASPRTMGWGAEWTPEFYQGGDEAVAGKKFGVGDSLLKRSHYGDLSALHGMAGADGESPVATKEKMMMWAEFTTKIASGEVDGRAAIGTLAMKNPQFKKLIADDPTLADRSVNDLFGIRVPGLNGADVKQRATGSLLHMIQDSYAEGHTQRKDLGGGRRGEIENFHSYIHQNHAKHTAADKFPPGVWTSESEKVHKMPGGQDAIDQGAIVLKMLGAKRPPAEILAYLDKNTFKTAAKIGPAEPGEAFKK